MESDLKWEVPLAFAFADEAEEEAAEAEEEAEEEVGEVEAELSSRSKSSLK